MVIDYLDPNEVKRYEGRKRMRNWRANNPLHLVAKNNWRKKNPEKQKAQNLRQRYGQGADKHFAKCIKEQEGKCALCGQPFTKPPTQDHNHKTGQLRGLLHHYCNGHVVGLLESFPELIELGRAYLSKYNKGATSHDEGN